jgi:hypothetical protein
MTRRRADGRWSFRTHLVSENVRRTSHVAEYELFDAIPDVFRQQRYFDVFIEYAKHDPEGRKAKVRSKVKGQRAKGKGQVKGQVKGQRAKVKGQGKGQRAKVKGQRSKVKGQRSGQRCHRCRCRLKV